jgi:hypothetical protein
MKPIAPLSIEARLPSPLAFEGPQVAIGDVQAVLARSAVARDAHEVIQRCAHGGHRLDGAEVQSLLDRAGKETPDVKMVLAYHAKATPQAFSEDGIRFLNKLDWSDIGSAFVDELRKQNADSEVNFADFIRLDGEQFRQLDGDRKRVVAGLQEKANQQLAMQSDSAFDTAAQIEGQAAQVNVTLSPVEATLLTLRARALRSQQ